MNNDILNTTENTEVTSNTLTESEVHELYTSLSEENNTNELNQEPDEYDEIEEIDSNKVIPGIGTPPEIVITENNHREVLKNYDITYEEATDVISLINSYKANESINYYDKLPKKLKSIADGIRDISIRSGAPMSKDTAAKSLLKEFMNDAEFNSVVSAFQSELSDTINDMNIGYSKLFSDAFDDVFSRIDEIQTTNPEQAEKIREVKAAFDRSNSFDIQKSFAQKTSAHKFDKLLIRRYDSCVFCFNKRVNVTDVKIPDIRELIPIIHNNLPQYTIDEIKKFIITICETISGMDFENNVADLAYIYKLINNIYVYKFLQEQTEESNLLFGNIAEVIECIINK